MYKKDPDPGFSNDPDPDFQRVCISFFFQTESAGPDPVKMVPDPQHALHEPRASRSSGVTALFTANYENVGTFMKEII